MSKTVLSKSYRKWFADAEKEVRLHFFGYALATFPDDSTIGDAKRYADQASAFFERFAEEAFDLGVEFMAGNDETS